jgi:NTE family protein
MSQARTDSESPSTVSLVLGSGGARGLAHIGVIEWLESNGYRIESIAGCSMGALVGGIHCAGKLPAYRDWVRALQRTDVLRFLDLAFRPGGLIKGDRIMETLRELVGEHRIEDLPIRYTAVATDIERQREVWLSSGPLFDAIRASIAVPTVFTPHDCDGLKLVDGGLLNPVPIAPTFRDRTDITIAVNLNGDIVGVPWPRHAPAEPAPAPPAPGAHDDERPDSLHGRILSFLDQLGNSFAPEARDDDDALGMFELVSRSIDTMQNAITAVKLAAYAPDVLISVPRDACGAHEFHRAGELIEIGKRLTEQQLQSFERRLAGA